MAHCLVTGATGFIGRHLVLALGDAGHEVTCLVRDRSKTRAPSAGPSREDRGGEHGGRTRITRGDVRDAAALAGAVDGADVVYHLAGRTRAFSYKEFVQVNVDGCRNVAQACATSDDPPVLVLVSTLAAGGPSTPDRPRAEVDADAPVSAYGRSKLAGEQAASEFASEVPLAIVRPPAVFGPGDRDGANLFQSIRLAGLHVVPGKRDLPMSLVHVADLCRALMLVAQHGKRVDTRSTAGETRPGLYYIADPEVVTYGRMGQLAADALGVRVRVVRVRKGWFALPALGGEIVGRLRGAPSLFNIDKLREVRATGWSCSPARIQGELGFQPAATLAERFKETAERMASSDA